MALIQKFYTLPQHSAKIIMTLKNPIDEQSIQEVEIIETKGENFNKKKKNWNQNQKLERKG